MKLTVVIVNYKVGHYLAQCLDSVYKALDGIDGEVIVVDNASNDGSVGYLKSLYPQATYIENKENVGFARANNMALRSTESEYVVLLNPDTFINENLFRDCIALLDTHPQVSATGVRMLNQDGSFALESRRGIPTPFTAFCKMSGLNSLFPESRTFGRYYMRYLDQHKATPIEIISGACMFIRREALQHSGLLDEDFFMYGEDIDLSYRMLRAGYDNYYIPTLMLHYKGESSNKNTYHYVHIFYQAMYIFFRKHYGNYNWALSLPIRLAIYMKGASEYVVRQIWLFSHRNHTLLGDMQHRLFLLKGSNRSMETMVAICEKYGLNYEQNHHTATPPDYIVYDTDAFSYGQILQELESQASQPGKHPLIATYSSIQRCIITGDMVFEA